MGILDRFRRSPEPPQEQPPAPAARPTPTDAFAPVGALALEGASMEAQRTALLDGFLAHGVEYDVVKGFIANLREGVGLLERGEEARGSRIGGPPLLPPDSSWPRDPGGMPMTFIAEFDFDELPALAPLPDNGRMLVYWSEHCFELKHIDLRAATRVFWVPGRATPAEAHTPEGATECERVPLTGALMPILGSYETLLGPDGEDDDALFDAYDSAMSLYKHQLLGPSRDIQGPVLEEVSYWLERADPSARDHYSASEVAGEGWTLLAQIDSTGDLMFGDAGALYLVIPEVDLELRRFDRVMGIMQCS